MGPCIAKRTSNQQDYLLLFGAPKICAKLKVLVRRSGCGACYMGTLPKVLADWLKLDLSRDQSAATGIVIVAPEKRRAKNCAPGPTVSGIPAAILFADSDEQITNFWDSLFQTPRTPASSKRVVLAEWDEHYLKNGWQLLKVLRRRFPKTSHNWMGNRVDGVMLSDRLRQGAKLAIYTGHGHAEGLSGYHGLYHDDLIKGPQLAPIEFFLGFACDLINETGGKKCFGRELVRYGYIRTLLSSTADVATEANDQLISYCCNVIAQKKTKTVVDLVKAVDQQVVDTNNKSVTFAWSTYRLLGNPLMCL